MQYLKIRYGEPFSIPRRLGDLFKEVVRIKGVDYVKGRGFVVKDYYALSNLNKILARLGLILTPEVKCFLCGQYIDCEKCRFKSSCRRDMTTCICDKCMSEADILKKYVNKQTRYLGISFSPSRE